MTATTARISKARLRAWLLVAVGWSMSILVAGTSHRLTASSGGDAVRRRVLKAAPDGQQARDPGLWQRRAQIDLLAALIEHFGLDIEYRQVARQPRAVALLGQAVGFLGGSQRLALLGPLRAHRIDQAELVGGLVDRAHHGVIVARHCLVEPGLAAAILSAQATAVEQRQRQARSRAVTKGFCIDQVGQAERGEACQSRQADVRIERRLGGALLRVGGRDARTRSD